MQNRSAIWVFTILLTLACLYQLSFSWVTSKVEKKATTYANQKLGEISQDIPDFLVMGRDTLMLGDEISPMKEQQILSFYEAEYLTENGDNPAYPIFGLSYRKCKDQQLSRGLDLQGGMSFTLEVSIPDLVKNKAGNPLKQSFQVPFNNALESFEKGEGDDFVDLFFEAYDKSEWKSEKMTYFAAASSDDFPLSMTKTEIKEKLKELAIKAIDAAETVIEKRVNRFGLSQINIQKQPISGRLFIEIPGAKDKARIRNMLQATADLQFWDGYNAELSTAFEKIDELLMANGEAIEEPVDLLTPDSIIVKHDSDYVHDTLKRFTLDGVVLTTPQDSSYKKLTDSLVEMAREEEALLTTDSDSTNLTVDDQGSMFDGRFTFEQRKNDQGNFYPNIGMATAAKDTTDINILLSSVMAKGVLPAEVMFLWSYKPENTYLNGKEEVGYVLYAIDMGSTRRPKLTGENVEKASYYYDQMSSKVAVNMLLDDDGTTVWSEWTAKNQGKFIGIVMDNVVYSFPVIISQIDNGSTQISGDFTLEEAQDLSSILEAGALPAPAIIVDENEVGPTLGEENIQKGLWSFVFAFAIVLLYMIFYYNKAGMAAGVALIANLFFVIGTLASLGAALTLPGIAGLVLTIGISVDANVIIYERIREELRAGKGLKLAIADGYKSSYSAILDANITSLLTAIILAYFGTGAIQSFATTLIIGVFSSLFSSIFITRIIFSHMLDRKSAITFSNKMTSNIFVNANFDFLGKRKIFYAISGLIVIGGIVSLATTGLNKSVEFTGGRNYRIDFSEAPGRDNVVDALSAVCVVDGQEIVPIVKTLNGTPLQLEITTKYLHDKLSAETGGIVDSVMAEGFANLGFVSIDSEEAINGTNTKTFTIQKSRSVNPQISNELVFGSFLAVLASLFVVFLYIALRFRKWQFGLGALIAMFHDVLIVLGLFSILYRFMPFSMEIDQAFIAAILTVVGYSINDTVIVYDRIREFVGLHKRDDQNKVINSALNTTLTRTINTSVTTFAVLLIIFVFGGESIKGFSFALMIGVVVGTYSSLFIATPSVVEFTKSIMPVKKKEKKS